MKPKAVLVGVRTQGREAAALDASMDELGRLCDTLGMEVVGRVVQARGGTGSAVLLGEGKLQELAGWTGGPGVVHRGPKKTKKTHPEPEETEEEAGPAPEARATVVVVDHELSPSQLRNLKSAAGVEVLDRNGVIIEIFSQRARTREARLQVELARLAYLAPRLRELGGPSERQQGGVGGKGSGETSVELDKRKIRDRQAEIRIELREIEEERGNRRARRKDVRQVALVGYTNAGKSSLMRALTGAEPYVADQLFATLDTTIRKLQPDVTPPILATDTVGFIQDLPHSLVASFRTTLDAALEAGLLLHVVDASDADWRNQARVTVEVLTDIGAADLARILLFNKCDRLTPEAREALRSERPDAWLTSAHDPAEVAALHARIVAFFDARDPEFELFVPWAASASIGAVHARTKVLSEVYEDDGVRFVARAPVAVAEELRQAVTENQHR